MSIDAEYGYRWNLDPGSGRALNDTCRPGKMFGVGRLPLPILAHCPLHFWGIIYFKKKNDIAEEKFHGGNWL